MVFKRMRHLFLICFYAATFLMVASMGDKTKPNGSATEPGFAKLAEGEGSFRVMVYGAGNNETVKDFSFFGTTSVGGVRRETDDSVTRLEVSKIREVRVLKPHYDSKRFGDKDFLLAEVTSATGSVTPDLLIPKKLVICGVDEKSGLEKSWFLEKIEKFVVQGVTPLVLPSIPSAITGVGQTPATAATPAATVVAPTTGSSDTTKRTFRPAKQSKWDAFYKEKGLVEQPDGKKVADGSVSSAFVSIIDAIIDFLKALITAVFKIFS